MRIYLDVCCLNRLFDDQLQDRIRQESQAVLTVIAHVREGRWMLLGSDVVEWEASANRDAERRRQLTELIMLCNQVHSMTKAEMRRSEELVRMGFKGLDAMHLACAEAMEADVFLTTDDALIRCAARNRSLMRVIVANPVYWLLEVNEP